MFYSQALLSRKGPLGNIWVAAYFFKKLKRHQIADTDITSSIDKIIPEVQISYRVLAQLLLGVVRIFSKQVDYLYSDCNEALSNIRRSFVPHSTALKKSDSGRTHTVRKKVVREPKQNTEVAHSPERNDCHPENETHAMQTEAVCAPYHDVTITIPDCFELDAFNLDSADAGKSHEHLLKDSLKPHEDSSLEGKWPNAKDQRSFLNEPCHVGSSILAEQIYACFSPIDDDMQSSMMDIEISEFHNSSSIDMRPTAKEYENHEGPRACSSFGTYLHGEHGGQVHSRENLLHEKSSDIHSIQYDEPKNQGAEQSHDEPSHEHVVHSENLQEKMPSDGQRGVHFDVSKDQGETVSVHAATPTLKERSRAFKKQKSQAKNLDINQDKSDTPSDSGLPSPQFAVTTPARKEKRHVGRKRKFLFDETIVLSNGTMRSCIHDASNLICKRRKVPHTCLDAWRVYRITSLQQIFMEPVVPYISPEHKAIFRRNLDDYRPQNKSTSLASMDVVNTLEEISNSTDRRDSLQGNAPTETPPPASYSGVDTPDRSEVRTKESSPLEIPASTLEMMDKDKEFESIEDESNGQDGGWSERTRAVAKYLYNKLVDLKEQKVKEVLNLEQILARQTRTKSARFFYEMLTLKGHGCIEIQQEYAYRDIVVSAGPRLQSIFNNQ